MTIRRRAASAAAMLGWAGIAVAQSAPQAATTESIMPAPATAPLSVNSTTDHVKVWASLSLGTINVVSDETSVPFEKRGGVLSLWATRGILAGSVRAAGTTGEVGPMAGDVAVLVGVHVAPAPHVDAVAAIGLGQGSARWYPTNFATEAVLAAGAQATVNFHVVGVGIDTFAAMGSTRRYAGLGLMLDLGWFR